LFTGGDMTHTKDEALKLAKECGATTYTNRHYPDATAVTFSPLAWEKFCEQALAAQPAPVQKAMPENWFAGMPEEYRKEAWMVATPPAAPVQPVASLKEVDVLMMAETHGIDPSTKGLYGFYIDCISNQPAAPIPDAITDDSESPEYRSGWNECREAMMEMMK
jgi:hypothetical protein